MLTYKLHHLNILCITNKLVTNMCYAWGGKLNMRFKNYFINISFLGIDNSPPPSHFVVVLNISLNIHLIIV